MSSPLHVYTLGIFSPLPKALLLISKTAGSKVVIGGKGVWVDDGRVSVGERGVCEDDGVWVDDGRGSVGERCVCDGNGVEVGSWLVDLQPAKLRNTIKTIM